MHNNSPLPVKWARECGLGLSRLEVSTQCLSEPCLPIPHLSHHFIPHPHPSPTLFVPFPPDPTQVCDVAVSDNEVRILLQQSLGLAPVCEKEGETPVYLHHHWSQAPSTDMVQRHNAFNTSVAVPPALHFKEGDQG